MQYALAEMPLALFTTLCAAGAGAFVTLAVAYCTAGNDTVSFKKVDKFTALPIALLLIGFICAFFHLANPMAVFGVFAGIGSSPLSNELIVGCIFLALALVLWIASLSDKLSFPARRGLAIAVAVVGVIFALFMGFAYMMSTIPSWDTAATPIQMLGYALVGGTSVCAAMLVSTDWFKPALDTPFKKFVLGLSVGGAAIAILGLLVQLVVVAGLSNALVSGEALVGETVAFVVLSVVCIAAACVCTVLATLGKGSVKVLAWASVVLALVGILFGRLAFYILELSVGPVM